MIGFKFLLLLQLGYVLLGALYNIVSIILLNVTGKGLSAASPITGIIAMLSYGVLLLSGFLHDKTLYRLLMGAALLILGYFGVIRNLQNYRSIHLYYSAAVWFLAVLINSYGVFLNFIAVMGKFRP